MNTSFYINYNFEFAITKIDKSDLYTFFFHHYKYVTSFYKCFYISTLLTRIVSCLKVLLKYKFTFLLKMLTSAVLPRDNISIKFYLPEFSNTCSTIEHDSKSKIIVFF